MSEGDDDDEEEEEGSVPQGDKYTIIGSLDDEDQPKWLAETVKVPVVFATVHSQLPGWRYRGDSSSNAVMRCYHLQSHGWRWGR